MDRDLRTLPDLAGTWRMPNGWQMVIRAEWIDASPGRPHGVDYALLLQDDRGVRLLGFDNAHGYDGAAEDQPFDHEHRSGAPGQTFEYKFISAGQLITDFFERCETYCRSQGVAFEIEFEAEDVS
jgi:hypothetical protein